MLICIVYFEYVNELSSWCYFSICYVNLICGVAHAADNSIPTPFQQLRDGVPMDAILCNEPRELSILDSTTPLCLSESTYETLSGYGLDIVKSDRSFLDIIKTVNQIPDVKEAEVQRIVAETIKLYELEKEGAFPVIDSIIEEPLRFYPFVLNLDTKEVVSHATVPDLIGTVSKILVGDYVDRAGELIVADLESNKST